MYIYAYLYIIFFVLYHQRGLVMIGERIKKIREASKLSQKDFAAKVNISLRTLQTYEQGKVEAVPFPVLRDIAENFYINLDWMFFGDGLMYKVLHDQLQASPYYTEALAIAENEHEIENCLKQFTKQKLIANIFPKSEYFMIQMINIIIPKTEQVIRYLHRALIYIKKDSDKIGDEEYKKFLISKIQNFDLLGVQNLGTPFTKWDKNKLISIIENLTENECKIILDEIFESIDTLKESLSFLSKIIS